MIILALAKGWRAVILIILFCLVSLSIIISTAEETPLSFEEIVFSDLLRASYSFTVLDMESIARQLNVLFVKTSAGRYAKLLLGEISQGEVIWSKIVVYDSQGNVFRQQDHLRLRISEQYDLDSLQKESKEADIIVKNELNRWGTKLIQKIYALNGALLSIPDAQGIYRSRHCGKLHLKSIPSGADIYIDDERKGVTPSTLWLVEGSHRIKLIKWGYEDWETTVVIKIGEERELNVELTALSWVSLSLRWRYETGDISSGVLGDIDGNGQFEIILHSNDDYLYILNSRGDLLWRSKVGPGVNTPALGDIDKDGELEIVIGSGHYGVGASIHAIDGTGGLIWASEISDVGGRLSAPALGDLDGDEKLEIVVGSEDGAIYVLDSDGKRRWDYNTSDKIWSSPSLGDLDSDGNLEIIFGSFDHYIYVLNYEGELIWKYKCNAAISTSPVLGDLDGNSLPEIVTTSADGTLYVLNAKGELVWSYGNSTQMLAGSPVLADLDGDMKAEIIVGSGYTSRDVLYALNSEGILMWVAPAPGSMYASPVIADINGDRELEIIAHATPSTILILGSNGRLKAFYEGKYQNYSSLIVEDSLALGDLEGDGKLEIVATDSYYGKGAVYVLSTEGNGNIQWGAFGGSPWHTGNFQDALSYGQALAKGPGAATQWTLGIRAVEGENLVPRAVFTFSPAQPRVGQLVIFDASDSKDPDGTISGYKWDFGDGKTGSGQIVSHAYDQSGVFKVILTVTDDGGASNTASITLTVREANTLPKADFSFSPPEPTDLDEIQFTDQSSDPDGRIVQWYWDFGDGVVSIEQHPSYRYRDDGTYTVTLAVIDNDGAEAMLSKTIDVSNVPPEASFSCKTSRPTDLDIVECADDSTDPDGEIVARHWDFGDGSTSAERIPTHCYQDNGVYTLSLTVTDDDGAMTTISQVMTVLNVAPTAAFTFFPSKAQANIPVTFDASSSFDPDGIIAEYFWEFGDGTTATSVKVTHTFAAEGVYRVKLTVIDNDGDPGSISQLVVVSETNKMPTADFTFSPQEPTDLDEVKFTDRSDDPDGQIIQWQWDFGDGFTSIEQHPSHIFRDDGTYTVTLEVIDNSGEKASVTKMINVANVPPRVEFSCKPEKPTDLEAVECIDRSTDLDGKITAWYWDFGDGVTSAAQNPAHHYQDDGIYMISLIVTDDDSATAAVSQMIAVLNVAPKAAFTFFPSRPQVNVPVTFSANNSFDPDGVITHYAWEFGDGATDVGMQVTHTFAAEGSYRVRLTVSDDDDTTHSTERVVLVMQEVTELIPLKGEKWALIIGISDYLDIRDLKFAASDAQTMKDVLVNRGGFPSDHVILLLNSQATKHAILDALGELSEKEKQGDLVIIYFSGHGAFVIDTDGDEDDGLDETIVPYDAEMGKEGSMIIDDIFGYWMRRLNSDQVVMIFDSCYSGGQGKSANVGDIEGRSSSDNLVKDIFTAQDRGRILIAASQPGQIAWEREDLGHGLFTYYLQEALQGNGDENKDGFITVEEAYRYTERRMAEYTAQQEWKQTPLIEDWIEGEVPITGGLPLEGMITAILGGKAVATLGDRVLINLGQQDGVQIGDVFLVYRKYIAGGERVDEVRGKIKVIELVTNDRSLAQVVEAILPIEVGDKVRRVQ